MDNYTATELAYKNGYEQGKKDAVKNGRWVKTENGFRENLNTGTAMPVCFHDCSVCGWHTGNQGQHFNYCPNCGAIMDGGEA